MPPINSADKPKRNNAWIYLTIILLLLTTNILLFTQNKKSQADADQQSAVATESKLANENLQIQYNAALARLDELTGKNAALDKIITDKDSELAKLKSRIESIISDKNATQALYDEARALIKNLNNRIDNYTQEINKLKQEKATATFERDEAIAKNKQLEAENETLAEQVDLGKVLSASNISITPIELKKGGTKEVETSKARRVDILRVKFDINENKLTSAGPQEIIVRIISPDGKLLSNTSLGSGTFKIKDIELLQQYSLSKVINLEQQQSMRNVSVDWQQTASYPKGSYTIELYNQGYLIGKSTTDLR